MSKYKVKTDLIHYISKGSIIHEFNGMVYRHKSGSLIFKDSSVIDRNPQWFEKIQDEFEIGDWVFYKPTEYVGRLIKESEWDKSSWQCTIEGLRKEKSRYRHATDDEIKQALVKEAKRRGYELGNFYCLLDGCVWGTDAANRGWTYKKEHDALYVGSAMVYENGEWAELVDQAPDITINGYDVEFHDDYVQFGCAKIDKKFFTEMYREDTDAWEYEGTGNRKVTGIRWGERVFTLDQIKEIAEYYEGKS